mmetsp:Transcript_2592/g.7690  ORF Transcript_2592/g.7690 Transcript_2592/m.7690 type:complete len:260 (+) Transcript_2592:304-1083(+)
MPRARHPTSGHKTPLSVGLQARVPSLAAGGCTAARLRRVAQGTPPMGRRLALRRRLWRRGSPPSTRREQRRGAPAARSPLQPRGCCGCRAQAVALMSTRSTLRAPRAPASTPPARGDAAADRLPPPDTLPPHRSPAALRAPQLLLALQRPLLSHWAPAVAAAMAAARACSACDCWRGCCCCKTRHRRRCLHPALRRRSQSCSHGCAFSRAIHAAPSSAASHGCSAPAARSSSGRPRRAARRRPSAPAQTSRPRGRRRGR